MTPPTAAPGTREINRFSEDDKRVIRERSRYDSPQLLGRVFGVSTRTINTILRDHDAPPEGA